MIRLLFSNEDNLSILQRFFNCLFQSFSGPPIGNDEDGHLAYKLGDIVETDTERCKSFVIQS